MKKRVRRDPCKITRPSTVFYEFCYQHKITTIHMPATSIQACSEVLIVIYANIVGISANKTSMLSELCKSVIVCVYRKPIGPQITQGPRLLV